MLLMMTYIFLFSGAMPLSAMIVLPYAMSLCVMSFVGYITYKRVNHPLPALVFESEGLRFPQKKDRFIPWRSITEWKIRRHKSNYRLVIRTPEGKTSVDITWLDHPAMEIKRMLEMYIRQPGPGGFMR